MGLRLWQVGGLHCVEVMGRSAVLKKQFSVFRADCRRPAPATSSRRRAEPPPAAAGWRWVCDDEQSDVRLYELPCGGPAAREPHAGGGSGNGGGGGGHRSSSALHVLAFRQVCRQSPHRESCAAQCGVPAPLCLSLTARV